ncbi:MAG: DtxR family transcriptional regulator [Bacillota bacterium]
MTGALTISAAMQDYLEVILELTEKEDIVRVTDIAAKLGVAKASVSQAINILANLKLVKQEKYGPIELTPAGKEQAAQIRRRHQILYRFLVEILNVDPMTAEKDACLIEHVVSPATLGRLTEHLEKMSRLKEERKEDTAMEAINTRALNELQLGAKGKVIRIAASGGLRRRILDMGVVPGAEVVVEGAAPLGDPIEVRVKGYRLSLRRKEAADIFVDLEE